jgi:hypothetical protein
MKLHMDDPKYGPKHIAVINSNRCEQLDWSVSNILCVDGESITNHDTQQDANNTV